MRRFLSIAIAFICAGAAMAALPAQVYAGDPFGKLGGSFTDRGRGSERFQSVTAYEGLSGAPGFILDRSGAAPLIRYRGDNEIYVLTEEPASRGDIHYKSETGRLVLNVSSIGGATIFIAGDKNGKPAVLRGSARPLRLKATTAAELDDLLVDLRLYFFFTFGSDVEFHAALQQPEGGDADVAADSARMVKRALVRIAEGPRGARALRTGLDDVLLVESEAASVSFQDETLLVRFVKDGGPAGRPSSDAIEQVLMRAL